MTYVCQRGVWDSTGQITVILSEKLRVVQIDNLTSIAVRTHREPGTSLSRAQTGPETFLEQVWVAVQMEGSLRPNGAEMGLFSASR